MVVDKFNFQKSTFDCGMQVIGIWNRGLYLNQRWHLFLGQEKMNASF